MSLDIQAARETLRSGEEAVRRDVGERVRYAQNQRHGYPDYGATSRGIDRSAAARVIARAQDDYVETKAFILAYGEESGAGVTEIILGSDSAVLTEHGVVIPEMCKTMGVGVSWKCDQPDPGGDWTLALDVRRAGTDVFEEAATFAVLTS